MIKKEKLRELNKLIRSRAQKNHLLAAEAASASASVSAAGMVEVVVTAAVVVVVVMAAMVVVVVEMVAKAPRYLCRSNVGYFIGN